MTDTEQREAARKFFNKWKNGGDEKQDCHTFWLGLLHDVMGVEDVLDYIQFEKPVKVPEADGKTHTRYIDGYIPAVKVLIEQKGSKHSLDEKEPQSGGEMLTPYEQGKRYNDNLPSSEKARWIVTCNFLEIWVYDMDTVVPEPQKIRLIDLQSKYPLLDFLVKKEVKELSHEMEVSIKAGDIVGKIYDAFLKQYHIPETAPKGESEDEKKKREHKLKSLNALCVRLVFLFYAEDAGIFERNQFHDYLEPYPAPECRNALIRLFQVLDTPMDERDEYLEENLSAFPYVNGGLFSDEHIIIPQITDELKDLLLKQASEGFNWRDISPTIFGAVFESTLNPETRRAGGMHYTSITNIHKVIDPLFLDDLKAEFKDIQKITVKRTKRAKLDAFQKKLASLVFLDPAAGSGNFLTETYLSLRRLENEVIKEKTGGQISFGTEEFENPIQVSIQQFYGIEINDFAVTVAKTALWIAESQMLDETKSILYGFKQDFLPLKTYVNITEGNALRINWNDVVDKNRLNYIMGNPPFVGHQWRSKSQNEDMELAFHDLKKHGKLDYVTAWYNKTCDFVKGTKIEIAFVSTNSISQGESVGILWKFLFEKGVEIQFAYRTFIWDSEANDKAHVHCVIIGFSMHHENRKKILFVDGQKMEATHINGYLLDAPDVFIESRGRQLFGLPNMSKGSQPTDGGFLLLSTEEKEKMISEYPSTEKFIKRFVGSRDLINNEYRYCLWLKGVAPSEYRHIPPIMERIEMVKQVRLKSPTKSVVKGADTPMLFTQIRQPSTYYLAVPEVSSQTRRYIPISFMSPDIIASNKLYLIPDATLSMFGILISNVHMAWTRVVCGRLKSDYSYSPAVYNNFPWPTPTKEQKVKIEKTAQGILDARALYPDSSLADLYDPLTMPPELRKAHTANDIAVMKAYGFSTKMSEADCVARLMEMYQELTKQ